MGPGPCATASGVAKPARVLLKRTFESDKASNGMQSKTEQIKENPNLCAAPQQQVCLVKLAPFVHFLLAICGLEPAADRVPHSPGNYRDLGFHHFEKKGRNLSEKPMGN